MSDSIRFKRGPKSQLSVLGLGEPGLTTDPDDQRLYIGGPSGNIQIPNMNDINKLTRNFYYSIKEINSEYNDDTPLNTIIESMINNSTLTARVAPSDTTNYPSTAYGIITIIKSIDNAILFYSKKNTIDTICVATWRKGETSSGFGISQWFDISQINTLKTGKVDNSSFAKVTLLSYGSYNSNITFSDSVNNYNTIIFNCGSTWASDSTCYRKVLRGKGYYDANNVSRGGNVFDLGDGFRICFTGENTATLSGAFTENNLRSVVATIY